MSKQVYQVPEVLSDHELLERFVQGEDARAFAILVNRHGAMILGVCHRLLRNSADADDAFQATFLTLFRKGHSIRRKMALPSWLYRVAVRIALRQLHKAQKHGPPVELRDVAMAKDPAEEAAWREAVELIDCEMQSLPESYRAPLLLCCVEGQSYQDAAAALDCPIGTVGIRMMRGREMLRKRLVRRGLLLAAGFVAANASWPQAQAQVPLPLTARTVDAGRALRSGNSSGGAVSPNVLRIMESNRGGWRSAAGISVSALTLGALSVMICVYIMTRDNGPQGSLVPPNNNVSNETVNPGPTPETSIKPKPGLWIARKKGADVAWAHSEKLAQAAKTGVLPSGPNENGGIVAIAIITPDLRFVQERQTHEGIIVIRNFAWLNGVHF